MIAAMVLKATHKHTHTHTHTHESERHYLPVMQWSDLTPNVPPYNVNSDNAANL